MWSGPRSPARTRARSALSASCKLHLHSPRKPSDMYHHRGDPAPRWRRAFCAISYRDRSEKIRSTPIQHSFACTCSPKSRVSDRRFGMHVEENGRRSGFSAKTQIVVDLGAHVGLDGKRPSCPILPLHPAGSPSRASRRPRLRRRKPSSVGSRRRGYVQIFGPDPERDLLPHIPAEPVCIFGRRLDLHACVGGPDRAIVLVDLDGRENSSQGSRGKPATNRLAGSL